MGEARPKLLILGANRYNVPSIRAARDAGFFTVVADRNPNAPGLTAADAGLAIDLVDADALATAVAARGGVHGIVSMAEVGVRAAARLAARLKLPSITEVAAANATSKAAMRRLWADIGGYSVGFRVTAREEEAQQAAAELGGYPLILKPDRSFGGSRGVSRVDGPDQVARAFQFAQSGGLPGSAVVIERALTGSEHSAEVLIWGGEVSVLCIGQKVKSPLPYRVDLSVQYPAILTREQEAIVADMCRRAVEALGLTQGVAHVEFCYTAEGPVLFEVGARCGGGHTPQIAAHVSGVNEFAEACRMACGLPPQRLRPCARCGADYRFLILPPGKLASVTIPPEVESHAGILDVGITLQPGEEVRSLRSTAERAGFLVALGPDRQAAVDLADEACRAIGVTYADGTMAHPYQLSDLGPIT